MTAASDRAGRWAWVEIDPAAIRHNVSQLRALVAPAQVWAVVKADGYGHGVALVADAALAAGAGGLCVALVQEGVALRQAGVTAPILVLSEQPATQSAALRANRLTPTVYRTESVDALLAADPQRPLDVHVKVDTGMQRVGVPHADAPELIRAIGGLPGVSVAGVYTHLACADLPDSPATARQLADFDAALRACGDLGGAVVHVANSAGALAHPRARRDLVRIGIAMYGISPGPGVDELVTGLLPALTLRARIAYVKPVAAGSAVGYGWRHTFARPTMVATLPIGYADGVPRRLGTLADGPVDVLVAGVRCPIVGVVTMDQTMIDVGPAVAAGRPVAIGDEVVLLGAQGRHRVRPEEWAARLGTIGYEIVCGLSPRLPRLVAA